MISAYLDASVVLQIVLEQPNPLKEWRALDFAVSSDLLRVECSRAVERLWREGTLSDERAELKKSEVAALLRNVYLRPIEQPILARAAEPFPTFIATLDAIHLATALAYRRAQRDDERPIVFATHDKQLAKAAAALHFEVVGA